MASSLTWNKLIKTLLKKKKNVRLVAASLVLGIVAFLETNDLMLVFLI